MAEVFMYMFFVGSGLGLGFLLVAFIAYKIWQRMNNPKKKRRTGGV